MKYLIILIVIAAAGLLFLILKALSSPAKLRKAEELLEEGKINEASEIVKRILDKKKDFVPAKFLRGLILMKQKQYVLAISEFNNILNIPDFQREVRELDIHKNLAFLYGETQNWQKEIEEYRIILTFDPDNINANHRIGHALYKQKEYKKVKEHLTRAINMDKGLVDCYLPLGISCFQISDYDNAEQYLTQALKVKGTDHAEAEFYLGLIYKMKKDFDNAILMFENAKKKNKYLVKSTFKIGEIYYEKGMYNDAIGTLEAGLKHLKDKSEESYEYRYLLAECYEHENKIKEAVHHWQKIAEENPDYRSTKIKLDSYNDIMRNKNLMSVFMASLDSIQDIIVELIANLNYNIISANKISKDKYQYKTYNIKRINDPPLLIMFHRTTKEITEGEILEFHKRVQDEKCKSGIYITTSRYSLKAKAAAQSKTIDLYDAKYVSKIVEKVHSRKTVNKG